MLRGKIAVVTGASRGIGRAIAIKLAELNAEVIVNFSGSPNKAEETVELIRSRGGKAEAVKCDVSDFEEVGRLYKMLIGKYGKIDILVNNAGITRDGLIMAMSEEDYDTVLNTNLKGAFNTIRHFSRSLMKNKDSRIINISSVSGIMGNKGQANYSASKAGLIGLTKSAARELAGRGVCVNAVAPGFIETDMTNNMPETARTGAIGMIPMGHMGSSEDVAEVVAFLAGPGGAYITGQVIPVDGGMSI